MLDISRFGQPIALVAAAQPRSRTRACTPKPHSRPNRGPRRMSVYAQAAKPLPTIAAGESVRMVQDLLSDSEDQRTNLEELRDKYGPIFVGLNVMGATGATVTIGDDKLIKALTSLEPSEAVVPSWPPSAIETFGQNAIVFANGKTHQTVKKSLTPVFLGKKRLKYLHTHIQEITDKVLSKAAAKGSVFRQTIMFQEEVERMYFEIALRARGPIQTAVGLLPDAEIGQLHRILVGIVEGVFVFLPEWMSPLRQRSSVFRKQAIQFLERVAADRRAGRREGDPGDAISALLVATNEHGEPYTDKDIAGHCLAMLFAGTLAMANAATTVACLCTQSTEAREALLAEMATWPEEEQRFRGPLDFGRINDSALFDSAIFEAMRWAPPVPGMFRRIDKDVNLDGREIPAGTNVIVSLLLQASDPHTYKEPGTYCPMRFVPGFSMGEPKPNTFGSGPHLCLGAEVAKAELKVLLALLLRDYTITLTEGTSDKSWVPSMLDGMKRKDGGKMLLEFKKDAPGADGALNAAAA